MHSRKGSTLIEIVIYALLLLIVLVMAYMFHKLGNQYLQKTRTQVELQQSASLAGSALVRDLSEAYDAGISSFPNAANPTAPPGVVMLSARKKGDPPYQYDGPGVFQYDAIGKPLWQRYVGYYLDTDERLGDDSVKALFRAEITLVDRGELATSEPRDPVTAGVTTLYLQTNPISRKNRKLVVHGLRAPAATPYGGLDVYSLNGTVKVYPTSLIPVLTNPVWIDLELLNTSTTTTAWRQSWMRTRLSVMARN